MPILDRITTGDPEGVSTIVLLHGYGSNMHDLAGLAPIFGPGVRVDCLQGPIDLEGGDSDCRAWYNLEFTPQGVRAKPSEAKAAADLIAAELDRNYADVALAGKLWLGGFSQGSMMSHAVLLRHPHLLRGIFGFSGRFMPEIFADAAELDLSGKSVFLSHGRQDAVIPFSFGEQLRDFYQRKEVDMAWSEDNSAHTISGKASQAAASFFAARR